MVHSDGNIGDSPVISCFAVFDTCNLPDSNSDDLTNYGKDEIDTLCQHFSELLVAKGYNPEKVLEERVPLWEYVTGVLRTTTMEGRTIRQFWSKILRRKGNSPDLKNILSLVKILLVLTFSTACVERGFSLMNRVKSDWRASIGEDSLNDLITLAFSRDTLSTFNPEPAIRLWCADSKKPRRLVDNYGPRKDRE